MTKDRFLKDNLVMFLGVSSSSVISLAYQLYVVRKFDPREFGLFNSLLAVLSIVSISLGALQTVTADFVARFYVLGKIFAIKHFILKITKGIFFFSLFFCLMLALFSDKSADFLRAESRSGIIITGIAIVLYFFLPVFQGALQGLQKFAYLGWNSVVQSVTRLILGVILISLGFKVSAAMFAFALSAFFALAVAVFALRSYIFTKPDSGPAHPGEISTHTSTRLIAGYFIPTVLAMVSFMVMTNIDTVLVKHFFSPQEAGHYSIAQMVGRIVLFFPASIILVMFPKVSEHRQQRKKTGHFLMKSLMITGLLCLIIVLIVLIFPENILKLISGRVYQECLPLSKLFALAMGFFALNNLFLYYNLSIRNYRSLYFLGGFALAEILLIYFFHYQLILVAQIICLISVLLFISNIFLIKNHE